jgi:hypothetical protein
MTYLFGSSIKTTVQRNRTVCSIIQWWFEGCDSRVGDSLLLLVMEFADERFGEILF